MKLQFKSAGHMVSYNDNPDWTNGTVREVEDDRAEVLLRDFPLCFFKFEDAAGETEPPQTEPTADHPTGETIEGKETEAVTEPTTVPIVDAIGSDLATTFEKVGFATAESVLVAKPEEVMSKTGINPKTFKRVQEACHKAVRPDRNKQLEPTENR